MLTQRISLFFLWMGIGVCLIACSSVNYEVPEAARKFAPGEYEAVLSGARKAKLIVDEEMKYEYVEDSPRNGIIKQVMTRGNLRFESWRKAKAGRVHLEWVSPTTIKVESPYASTIGHGNNEGSLSYSAGPFLTGMPRHVFYLTKAEAKE